MTNIDNIIPKYIFKKALWRLFLWIPGVERSVFALVVWEESLPKETQWDQIRLMTRQKELMTNF